MLGFPQMGDFSVTQTFRIPLSFFLRMLMINRVTDGPFRAAFFVAFNFVFYSTRVP